MNSNPIDLEREPGASTGISLALLVRSVRGTASQTACYHGDITISPLAYWLGLIFFVQERDG